MIDPENEASVRVAARLHDDLVAWLITVAPDGTPMPTPVWFWWDGESLLIYSQPDKPKLRNIQVNPHVAVALRTDALATELAVITGDAAIDGSAPKADDHAEYIAKYTGEIHRLGSDPVAFAASYSVPIRVTPSHLRAE